MTIKCGKCGCTFKSTHKAIQHLKAEHPELVHIVHKASIKSCAPLSPPPRFDNVYYQGLENMNQGE